MLKALDWLPGTAEAGCNGLCVCNPSTGKVGQEFKIILSLCGSLRPALDTGDLISNKRKKKPEEALGGGCPKGAEAVHLCEGPFPSVPPIAAGKKLANALG